MSHLSDNYVHLRGFVKRDAQSRHVRDGLTIMDFTLVVPSGDTARDVYVDCVAYGRVVGDADGYVEEGELISVEGRIGFRTWTDTHGIRKRGCIIVVDAMEYEEEQDVD